MKAPTIRIQEEGEERITFHHSLFHRSNGRVEKMIEPQFSFAEGEQESLIDDILSFRSKLRDAGVPIVDDYNLSQMGGFIIEDTINCGRDGYQIIQVASRAPDEVLSSIAKGLLPVLETTEITLVPDPHPANWCFDAEGQVHYVDFAPPRFKRHDGTRLVGFPQPTGEDYDWAVGRYYSKSCLLRVLRFNLMRAGGPCLNKVFDDVMKATLPETLLKQFREETADLPEQRVRRGDVALEDALAECDVWHIDDIRELALMATAKLPSAILPEHFLGRVLNYTRADFKLTIPERQRNVDAAKLYIHQNYTG